MVFLQWSTIIAVLAALLAALTLLPLSRHPAWWVRGLDFPRLQIFLALLALLVACVFLLDMADPFHWLIVAVVLACTGYHLWWILPYTRLFPREVLAAGSDEDNTIGVMVANVLTPNRQAGALLDMVRAHRPDILLTLESDAWWESRLDVLAPEYPHAIKHPLDNLYGMHLYSRLPLSDGRVQFLVEEDVPSIHVLVTLRSGREIRLHCLHPAPPSPTENAESSERDAELLIVGKSVAGSRRAVIVAGDLNDVAWSATTRLFRKISGLLDPRVGRGMFNTFHAGYPFLRWPLDHLFHSAHFRLADIRRLPGFGSDHFPVLVILVHDDRERSGQSGLDADADDYSQAGERMRDEFVSADDVHRPGE